MSLQGEFMGMSIHIDDLDQDNLAFFEHCGRHELRLQQCAECGLKRFPPTTACPFCAAAQSTWEAVSGRGVVYSYGEVHHAIQPVFAAHTPYMLLLVELDEQRGQPGEFDGLRVQTNLVDGDGQLAPPDLVCDVGIGTRVKVVFRDVGEGLALPAWTVDEADDTAEPAWRYAIE
ncbi:MAG: OB-fold domain-containing protein [Pseudomonadota bacterium]